MSGFDYVIMGLMGIVALVLISGLIVMAVGGKTNEKYSNKLMMVRVASQGLVVMLLGALFLLSR